MKKRVYFKKGWGTYNPGDRAGFEPNVAKKLESQGIIGYTEDLEAAAKVTEVEAVQPEAPEADAPSKREELEALNVDELKKQLGELGLPVSGTKAELVDRLLEEEG